MLIIPTFLIWKLISLLRISLPTFNYIVNTHTHTFPQRIPFPKRSKELETFPSGNHTWQNQLLKYIFVLRLRWNTKSEEPPSSVKNSELSSFCLKPSMALVTWGHPAPSSSASALPPSRDTLSSLSGVLQASPAQNTVSQSPLSCFYKHLKPTSTAASPWPLAWEPPGLGPAALMIRREGVDLTALCFNDLGTCLSFGWFSLVSSFQHNNAMAGTRRHESHVSSCIIRAVAREHVHVGFCVGNGPRGCEDHIRWGGMQGTTALSRSLCRLG